MATPTLALPGRGNRVRLPAALRAKRRRERWTVLGFLSPWLFGFSVFFAYPLIAAVYFSFYYYDQFNAPVWVGLKNWNYILFNFPDFVTGLKNTLWLVLVMVTLQIIFGLGVSLLITKIKRGGN